MKLSDKIYYVGVNDRTKHKFEAQWLLPQGISYNSYLVTGEKVALVDTVEEDFFLEFLQKVKAVLGDRPIDYLIINHMEPDHSGSISLIRQYYPNLQIVGNKKTLDMVQGFYDENVDNAIAVTEGSTLNLGANLTLRFHLVPMLHWPETMVTYYEEEQTLFSGDAFGCFGALNGHVVDVEMDIERYIPEMERYYAAILGKYGQPVQTALKKLGGIALKRICSTHGPVWTEEIPRIFETYRSISAGETEEGVVICYGSMYDNTRLVAEAIAEGVASQGIKHILVHNLSVSAPSFVLRDIFKYRGLAIGSPTYNGSAFSVVEDLLKRLTAREVRGRKLAIFGGYSWASKAVSVIQKYNESMKMEEVASALEWKQGATPEVLAQARQLGEALGKAVKAEA